MITFSELREQAQQFYNELLALRVPRDGGEGYERMPYSIVKAIKDEKFPDFPVVITDTFIVEGPLLGQRYGNWTYSTQSAQEGLKFMSNPANRLTLIYWRAMVVEFGRKDVLYGVGANQHVIYARGASEYGYDEQIETLPMSLLGSLAVTKPSIETVKEAAKYHAEQIERLRREVASSYKSPLETGLGKVLTAGPSGDREWKVKMEGQLKDLMSQLPSNGLAARTWGFEIESPDCKGVLPLAGSGIDKGDDGSLRSYEGSDECECGCSDCTYHECTCDNCNDYNDDPQHCGDSDCTTAESAEYRSTGGIQRVKHNGMYKLCEDLTNEDAEMNDSAGTHIHVWGQDLTTQQVGQVLATYKRMEGLFSVLCGRDDTQYARKISVEHIRMAIDSKNPMLKADKPRAVNISNLLTDRGTIEFRQMDCNYNAERITFYAWLVRGLVETAKRGAQFTSFMKVTDFNDLVTTFGKFNYFIAQENPELIVPGTKTDMNSVQKVTHKVA